MAYFHTLEKSAKWLAKIQNSDNGWGLTQSQASSLVNTSEAIYVLHFADKNYGGKIANGIKFIRENWQQHLVDRGEKLRFIAFPLYVVDEIGERDQLGKNYDKMVGWILKAQRDDGGWGAAVGDDSDIYSTFLAVQALRRYSYSDSARYSAQNWILSNLGERGWSFRDQNSPSSSATSYALLALKVLGYDDREQLQPAISFLLQTSQWADEEATLAGTLWKHCTHSNVLAALATYSDDLFSATMSEGIRYSNSLIHGKGGWMETTDTRDNRTVRAQYWAVYYSQKLIEYFDPSKFVLRVDAERTGSTLRAPAFQHFFVQTPTATIIPTSVFRMAVIATFSIGVALALNANRLFDIQFSDFSRYVGLLLILSSFVLVQKRRSVFPRFSRLLVGLLGAAGVLDILFGKSIYDVFGWATSLIGRIGEYLARLSG